MESAKHTELRYLYRDGCNNKAHGATRFRGSFTPEDEAKLRAHLDGIQFIPGQVGLADLQQSLGNGRWAVDIDHPWHEFLELAHVDHAPECAQEFQAFLPGFLSTAWDEAGALQALAS